MFLRTACLVLSSAIVSLVLSNPPSAAQECPGTSLASVTNSLDNPEEGRPLSATASPRSLQEATDTDVAPGETSATEESFDESIVVTAQKRDERL